MIFLSLVIVNILLNRGVSTCPLNQNLLNETVNQTVSVDELVLLQWNYVQLLESEKSILANEYKNISIQNIDQISKVNDEKEPIYFIFGHDIPESKLLKSDKLRGSLNIILYGNVKNQSNDDVVRKLQSLAQMNENRKIFVNVCVENEWKAIDINNLKCIESDKMNTFKQFQKLHFISLNSAPFTCSKNKEKLNRGIECELMAFISDNLKIPFTYKVFESSQHDSLLQIMNEAKWDDLRLVLNFEIVITNIRRLKFSR